MFYTSKCKICDGHVMCNTTNKTCWHNERYEDMKRRCVAKGVPVIHRAEPQDAPNLQNA